MELNSFGAPRQINSEMKKALLLGVLSLLSIAGSGQTKKVLFIGNSYTGSNNLPKLIHDAALSAGDSLIYDSRTPGGARLLNHSADPATIAKIYSDNWDFVVIQAQSQEPSWSDAQVATEVFPHAQILCDTIRANDTCSKPVFYMTWGRENGDANNCPFAPWVCTYEGMDSVLNKNYRQMGADNNALVSPVGAAWRYVRENHPGIQLYTADGSHPSLAGSYLAACTFYSILFKKDPTAITFKSTLAATTANTLRQAAKKVAYDSLTVWNVDTVKPTVSYTYTLNPGINECIVTFSNLSSNVDYYEWDFGDGSPVSNAQNPTHIYTANGSYEVILKGQRKCEEVVHKDFVIVNWCGISLEEQVTVSIKLFPNPANKYFQLDALSMDLLEDVLIYNMQGQLVQKHENYQGGNIDVRSLPAGYYQVQVSLSDGRRTVKSLMIQN